MGLLKKATTREIRKANDKYLGDPCQTTSIDSLAATQEGNIIFIGASQSMGRVWIVNIEL